MRENWFFSLERWQRLGGWRVLNSNFTCTATGQLRIVPLQVCFVVTVINFWPWFFCTISYKFVLQTTEEKLELKIVSEDIFPLSARVEINFLDFAMGYRAQIILSVLVTQLCPTLSDPMNCGPPGFSVLQIFQARILEWVCHSLPQGIYLILRLNLGLRWILYPLNHQQNPSLFTIPAFRGTRNYSIFRPMTPPQVPKVS